MKRNLLILPVLLFVIACSSTKDVESIKEIKAQGSEDSTEYELVVFDPGFTSWFATNRKPKWYHSHNFYKNWNKIYVNEWNYRVTNFKYQEPYDFMINYDPQVDYGLDVDYELYWWFKFMEDKYHIKLATFEGR